VDDSERDTYRVRLRRISDAYRSARTTAADAMTARDEAFWEAEAAGFNATDIARASGTALSTVQRVLVTPH